MSPKPDKNGNFDDEPIPNYMLKKDVLEDLAESGIDLDDNNNSKSPRYSINDIYKQLLALFGKDGADVIVMSLQKSL